MTYRLAISVALRSPAAYRCIERSGIISVPSLRSIKRKVQAMHPLSGGVDEDHLRCQRDRWGSDTPVGVLIFDEVKLVGKMSWNSNSHEISGKTFLLLLRCNGLGVRRFHALFIIPVTLALHEGFRMRYWHLVFWHYKEVFHKHWLIFYGCRYVQITVFRIKCRMLSSNF